MVTYTACFGGPTLAFLVILIRRCILNGFATAKVKLANKYEDKPGDQRTAATCFCSINPKIESAVVFSRFSSSADGSDRATARGMNAKNGSRSNCIVFVLLHLVRVIRQPLLNFSFELMMDRHRPDSFQQSFFLRRTFAAAHFFC